MKAPSHRANSRVYTDHAGNLFPKVDVSFTVPDRIAALLPEAGGVHMIRSISMERAEQDLAPRAHGWAKGIRKGVPLCDLCARSIDEGCTEEIHIRITPEEWHFIGMICGRLRISPAEWLLACATYNADLEEKQIEAQLAALDNAGDSIIQK